jgi:acetate kinase
VADLAPLHVPPTLELLEVLRRLLPDVPHVLCPDTAFHADLPVRASTYPLPAEWRRRWGLRRYGFHGLSYAYAVRRAAELLGRPAGELRMVLAHLGGGASVCAVRDGRSVDTSMGFTPLDGVPMSTRSGAIDPGMLLWLLDGRLTRDEAEDGLYHHAGLLGLSGDLSGDTRELVAAGASLPLDVFTFRVRREMAAAATSLDRLDAIVFTGEIGWDQPEVRRDVCAGLGLFGVPMPVLAHPDHDGPVSPADADVPVLVIEPREELQIARDTRSAL